MIKTKSIIAKILGDEPKTVDWIYKDSDKDGVSNFKDCDPYDKTKQGIIHKTMNFLKGNRFQDIEKQKENAIAYEALAEKAENEKKAKEYETKAKQAQASSIEQQQKIDSKIDMAEKKAEEKKQEYSEFKEQVKKQEAQEKIEEDIAKQTLNKPMYAAYKTIDKTRDLGQSVVRGVTEMTKYKNESDVYDYEKSAGYDLVKKQAEQTGVVGIIGKTAKAGIDLGEGTIRGIPGFAPTKTYELDDMKERPFVYAGQQLGELASWEGAGFVASKGIGNIGNLGRVASDTSKAGVVRVGAKMAQYGLIGGKKVLTSKPIRLASDGWTGEAVDIAQGYLGQRTEINQAISDKKYKEAVGRFGLGYAVEKAGDYAVSGGFKSGLPTKTISGAKTVDVDKFIHESGSDPKIARMFEVKTQQNTFWGKAKDISGIDFSKPNTKIDMRILEGTTPLKGGEWDLSGVKTSDIKGMDYNYLKGFKGFKNEKIDKSYKTEKAEKAEKAEKDDKTEKSEKAEKAERAEKYDKLVKAGVFDNFALPIGSVPSGYGRYNYNRNTQSKIYTGNVMNAVGQRAINPVGSFGNSNHDNAFKGFNNYIKEQPQRSNDKPFNFNKSVFNGVLSHGKTNKTIAKVLKTKSKSVNLKRFI